MKNTNYFLIVLMACIFLFFSCGGTDEIESDFGKNISENNISEVICNCFDSNIKPIDEKIIWNGTINDDFDSSSILVVMDKNFSRLNTPPNKCFFGDINIENIMDLTTITGDPNDALINWEKWHQIIMIKLFVNSKENIVNVIRQLEKKEGIMSVEPNHSIFPAGIQ